MATPNLLSQLNNIFRVDSLAGGATGLKTIITAGITGKLRAIAIVGTTIYFYETRTGTDADNSPNVVRPTDYNASTNQTVWELKSNTVPVHTHAEADVTNLVTDLAARLQTANDLSEINTQAKRSNARGNLNVYSIDRIRGFLAARAPRGGLSFDASATDMIQGAPGTGLAIGTADFTITGTFRFDTYPPVSSTTFLNTHSSGSNFVQLYVNTAGAFVMRMDNAGGQTDFIFTPDQALVAGEIYHFALSALRAGLATLYINAASDRDQNGTAVSQNISALSVVSIGSGNGGGYRVGLRFPGTMFTLRVFNRALSASEVLGLLERGYVDTADQYVVPNTFIISPATLNGGFETAGAGGVDAFANWAEAVAGTTVITRDTTTFNSGAASAKFAVDASNSLAQITNGTTTVGKRYFLSFWAKSDVAGTILFCDSAGVVFVTLTTSWAFYSVEYIPATDGSLIFKRGGNAASRSIWIDDVTLRTTGCLFDLDLEQANPIISTTVRDRTGVYDGTLSLNNVQILTIKQQNPERLRVLRNVNIGGDLFGTSADKVLGITSGTDPSTSPADMVQLWSADRNAVAGKASLHLRTEDGTVHCLGDLVGIGMLSPVVLLEVNGTLRSDRAGVPTQYCEMSNDSAGGYVTVVSANKPFKFSALDSGGVAGASNMMQFWTGTTAVPQFRGVIDNNGNVGLGGTITDATNLTNAILVVKGGLVGVNTSTPNTNLDVNGFIEWSGQKRVSTQFDAVGSTALANVTGLSVTLVAGKTYHFRAMLDVAADVTGGSKFSMGGTATATAIFFWVTLIDGSTNLNTINSRQSALAGSAGQAGTLTGKCLIEGVITVNGAGTLTVQFAQNAAAGTSSVKVGSILIVQQIN